MGISRVGTIVPLRRRMLFLAHAQTRGLSASAARSKFERIGFIGLGNMGSRMAKNLVKAGYELVVHDVNRKAMMIFSEMGVPTRETPSEVAQMADAVVTMLPSSSHVADVYTGKNGLIQNGNIIRPKILIDSSTIDPETSRDLSNLVSACVLEGNDVSGGTSQNPEMLDAPVSGGVIAAEAGTLTFMVGGSEIAYEAAKDLLLSMGNNTIYCGGAGNGTAAKICNNLAMAVSMLGISEAIALGQKLGLDATTLTNVLNSSSGRCWSSESYNPVPGVMKGAPASNNYVGGFASKLMAKDLNIAATSAESVGFPSPMTTQAKNIYEKLCEMGHESRDFSCVFHHYYSGNREDK